MTVERVEGLHFLAGIVHVQTAVGEHAVHIENGKANGAGSCENVIHGCWLARRRRHAASR